MERTLVLIKPDAVQRRLIGRIIHRFEDKGWKITGLKMVQVTEELAEKQYAEHKGKSFYEGLMRFITSSPIIALVLEGRGVIASVRKLMGSTNSLQAETGTIRGDFGIETRYNLVHGSADEESAKREISLFFEEDELFGYSLTITPWLYE